MKIRQPLAILLSLLLFVTVSACAAKKAVQIDMDKLANKLISTIPFDDQLTKLDDKAALKLYDLQADLVAKESVYVGTGATAEEISIWQAKDANSAKKVKEAVLARIETQKESFTDYVPKEMTKLKDPTLIEEGDYIILCLSNNNSKAKQIIDGFIN